jgi:bifunctional DNase/RNase
VAGDFDKLFGDDWQPQDGDPEGPSSLSGREGDDAPAGSREFRKASGDDPLSSLPSFDKTEFTSETENLKPRTLNEKEVKVMGVYIHQEPGVNPQHFVSLRDNRGRMVKIYVGQFEALAISIALDGEVLDRPMTHDLIKLIVDRFEASIERVVIDDLWNDTFYAKIGIVKADGGTMDIDARPSDAIAAAIRSRAPIYMAESVLEATVRAE